MSEYENWLWEEDERLLTLTLNRPKKSNRISTETLHELRDISKKINERDDIWCVVVKGAGKHFSTGVDVNNIGGMLNTTEEAFKTNLRNQQDCLDQFEAITKPTIAQIHGYCLGGGMLLTLCCDFRIADESAMLGLPEVKRAIGVIMGMQRITKIAGIARTKELAMMGENIDAATSYEYGLLHKVVPTGQLAAAVAEVAAKFQHLPPKAVSLNKQIVDETLQLDLQAAQLYEAQVQYPQLSSADFREAIASFMEKRPPVYTGK